MVPVGNASNESLIRNSKKILDEGYNYLKDPKDPNVCFGIRQQQVAYFMQNNIKLKISKMHMHAKRAL